MKFSLRLVAISVACATICLTSVYGQEGAKSSVYSLPASVQSAIQQANFIKAESDLLVAIKKLVSGKSADEIMADKGIQGLADAWYIIHTTGASHMDDLLKRDKSYAPFFSEFFKNRKWMELYLRAGIVPKDTDVGLRVLGDIWKAEGKSADFVKYLNLATGIASSWGAGGFANRLQQAEQSDRPGSVANPVWRFRFFRDSYKAGKLYGNFLKLQPWEIRFVAGTVWDDASLAYLQKTVNLPPNMYDDACWKPQYCGTSEFGDSIQGPLFYVAWDDHVGQAQMTVEHGGVCGALSHVGSTAASARGIPSYPVGQPGHCAYGYRLKRGEWIGGFGGPHGGPHNYIFPGTAPTVIDQMEVAFADDAKVATAYRLETMAQALAAAQNVDKAKELWDKTIALIPLNYYFQKEYQEFIKSNKLFTNDQWYNYALNLVKEYNGHGYATINALKEVESEFVPSLSDEQKLVYFSGIQNSLAVTPSSWATDIAPILKAQEAQLTSDKAKEKYLSATLNAHMNKGKGANFGKVMEWALTDMISLRDGKSFASAFKSAVKSAKSSSPELANDKKAMKEAYSKAIVAAENSRSLPAVRAVAKAAEAYSESWNGPSKDKMNLPEGKLVSAGGYMRLSSTSGFDSPCSHLGVLDFKGGIFHTSEEEHPYVIIELPKPTKLTGLLLIKNPGNENRTKNLKISRSVDGETWFEVVHNENTPNQWKVDVKDESPAKWIKVEVASEGKTFMHLRNILVFGK